MDLSTRVDDTFVVILSYLSTRVMSWPVMICHCVEEIISLYTEVARQTPRAYQSTLYGTTPLQVVATFFLHFYKLLIRFSL